MSIPTYIEPIKRPATSVNQRPINLNTRLVPLAKNAAYIRVSTDTSPFYSSPSNNLNNNTPSLFRYNVRKLTNVTNDVPTTTSQLYSQNNINTPGHYIDNTHTDPSPLNVEGITSSITGRYGNNNHNKSSVSTPPYNKPSFAGNQRKITAVTKLPQHRNNKLTLKDLIRKKSKITLKCCCILILLLIPIIIFIIMMVYSSSLEFEKPKELPKDLSKELPRDLPKEFPKD
uniref:Unspecified product n=1 Tax=Parastrongyloides trichosuri TaxID=131310 RepID=A0A0N5A666_PARTI